MAKEKKIIVSFRIEKSMLERLKCFARKQSLEKNKDISYASLIREMIRQKVAKNG